ncbi:MAG: polysaccharide deacetylase family protein [Bacillus sp. (in: firmicutes)]
MVVLGWTGCHDTAEARGKSREAYEKTGEVIWDFQLKEKIVSITFDDGPHPVFTPKILDILAKYDAHATFFVAGNKVNYFPDVLKRVVEEGHEVGNHTYSHKYRISAAKLSEELKETDEIIEQHTGYQTTLYRPVGGYYNQHIIDAAVKNGKQVVLWSWQQDPKDWKRPKASKMVQQLKKGLQPGNIILFHDWIGTENTKESQTVVAFEQLMEYLYENGYRCVTVSELIYRAKSNLPEMLEPIK